MTLSASTRAVITGAGSGLGKALAVALARRGARLQLSDRNQEAVAATAHEALSAGAREAAPLRCDVSQLIDIEALADDAAKRWGGVDLLINNAGIGSGGEVGETDLDTWRRTLDINLWGVIYGCHVFAPLMRRQRSGHILNVASVAGLVYSPGMGPYNVSKAGVVALSETMAAELRPHGVGVTVLCPSFFLTGILDEPLGVDERGLRFARAQMKRSKLDAAGVAEAALRAVEADQLHAVPMLDGRMLWRARRLAPSLFVQAVSRLRDRAMARGSR